MEEENRESWETGESMGYYEIVVNKKGTIGQQYTIPQDGSFIIDDELEIYRMRQLQNHYLVKVIDIEKIKSKSLCSGQNCIRIITERIPHRLDEVRNLTQKQALYCLYCCLQGFKVICDMLGPVLVQQRMIGIDSNGKIKVWTNQNYSRNYAESNHKIGIVKDKAIQKMVVSIMQAIKTYNLPEDLIMKLRRILSTSMQQHLNVIQKYLKQQRIDVSLMKVQVLKQQKSLIEGQGKANQNNMSNLVGPDESTSIIQGVPYPVSQFVHNIYKKKIIEASKQNNINMKNKQKQNKTLQDIQENKDELIVPQLRINPPSKINQQKNNNLYPLHNVNNRPRSQMPEGRPISPMINGQQNNNYKRPPSSNTAQNQFLQMPSPMIFPGQVQHRGFSPRPTSPRQISPRQMSPRPHSPNPHFINPQYQISLKQAQLQQQQINYNPQIVKVPAIKVKQQIIQNKKQRDLAQSQCKPLGTMQFSQCHPLQKPMDFTRQQQQRMMMHQMGNPFGPMFAHQMMDPQMFMPPPISSNFLMSPNMPPPMSHLSPSLNQMHQQHQYIHSQLFQNLSPYPNHNSNIGFIPSSPPQIYHNNRY